jgi:hypothetical protein
MIWIGLAALALLAGGRLSVGAGAAPAKKSDAPKPLPPDIVRAWQNKGAEVVWMRLHEAGYLEILDEKEARAGALPVFQFRAPRTSGGFPPKLYLTEVVLTGLPDPGMPFGLALGHTKVTDEGLRELARLKSLQSLHLYSADVTDAGLKELAALKNLQSLYLGSTKVTDAGLKKLAGLKSLQSLYLYSTEVTDAGLKELAGLKSLQSLGLGSTKVMDMGLKELAGLNRLKSLNLAGTKVTGTGLKELAGLKSLQSLELDATQVTDAGLSSVSARHEGSRAA